MGKCRVLNIFYIGGGTCWEERGDGKRGREKYSKGRRGGGEGDTAEHIRRLVMEDCGNLDKVPTCHASP